MTIKAYSNKELAEMYGITYNAWLEWIKPIKDSLGKNVRGLWNPKQVEQIVNHLGLPTKEIKELD